jgi:hypothetical protein
MQVLQRTLHTRLQGDQASCRMCLSTSSVEAQVSCRRTGIMCVQYDVRYKLTYPIP